MFISSKSYIKSTYFKSQIGLQAINKITAVVDHDAAEKEALKRVIWNY